MHTIIPHLGEASFNDADTLPFDFDVQRFPILATHWFGIEPRAAACAAVVSRLGCEQLCAEPDALGDAA